MNSPVTRRLRSRMSADPNRPPHRRLVLECLEQRNAPAVIAWDGGPDGNGTLWLDAVNWAGDVLPGANDDATIGATGTNPVIELRGSTSVLSVTNARNVQVVANSSVGSVTLTITAGGTNSSLIELTSTGSGFAAILSVSGGTLTNAGGGTIASAAGAGGFLNLDVAGGGQLVNQGTVGARGDDLIVSASGSGSIGGPGTFVADPGRTLTFSGTLASLSGNLGGAGTIRFNTGATATLSAGGLTVLSGATAVLSGNTISGPGTLALASGATLVAGSASTVNAPVANNGTILVRGTLTLAGATTAAAGAVLRVENDGSLVGLAKATVADFANAGLIEVTSAVGPRDSSLAVSGGTLTNAHGGVIAAAAGTGGIRYVEVAGDGQLVNQGTVTAASTDLIVSASGTASIGGSGTFAVGAGRTLTFVGMLASLSGNLAGAGTIQFSIPSASLSAAGLTVLSGATVVLSGNTFNGPGTLTVAAGGTLVAGSTSTVNAPVVNNGTILVRGLLTLAGATTAAAGSVLRVENDGGVTNNATAAVAGGFANAGLIELSATNSNLTSTLAVSGTLTNGPGGTIAAAAGASGFRNIDVSGGGQLVNQGTVVAAGSDLSVSTSGSGSIGGPGTLTAAAGRTVAFGGTLASLSANLGGAGTILFLAGVTATLSAGGLTVLPGATAVLSINTINGPGTLTVAAGGTLVCEINCTVNAPVANGGTILVRSLLTLAGATTAADGAVLRVENNGSVFNATVTVAGGFVNAGLIELSATNFASTLAVAGGALTNAPGGTIAAAAGTGGNRFVDVTSGGQLLNPGTIIVIETDLTNNIATGLTVVNTGTIFVAPGRTLNLTGGGTITAGAAPFVNVATILVGAGVTFNAAAGLTNAPGATLGGSGTVSGAVGGPGTVSPGSSPGNITVVGGITLGGELLIEIEGPVRGSGFDTMTVMGGVNLIGPLRPGAPFNAPVGMQFLIIDNDGTDPVVGTFAGLPEGAAVTANGQTFSVSYVGGTGNDVVLTRTNAPPAPPHVTGAIVNGGVAQRSRVASLAIRFDSVMTFAGGNVAAAFGLSRIGGGAVGGFTATAAVVGGVTVVTLSSFTGAETQFGSLADGRFSVLVRANLVSSDGRPLDGNGDGTGGDDFTLAGTTANGLFRLYGDVNGDGVINAVDFGQFRGAFGTSTGQVAYRDFLDFDGDGQINAFDFAQFRTRFGSSVP